MEKIAGSLMKLLMGSNETRMDADAGVKEIVAEFQQDLKGVLTRDDIRTLIKPPAIPKENPAVAEVIARQLGKDMDKFMEIGGFGRVVLCRLLDQPTFREKIAGYLESTHNSGAMSTVEGFIGFLRPAVVGGDGPAAAPAGDRAPDVAPDMYYIIRALLKDKDLVKEVLTKILEENIRELMADEKQGLSEEVRQATAKFITAYADKIQPWTAPQIYAVVATFDEPTKKLLQGIFAKLKETGGKPTDPDVQAAAAEVCRLNPAPAKPVPPAPPAKGGKSRRRRRQPHHRPTKGGKSRRRQRRPASRCRSTICGNYI